jgi:hypothetical protein
MVWPIIRERNSFRVASSYGRGSDQSTNGSSDRACRAQSACFLSFYGGVLSDGFYPGYSEPSRESYSAQGLVSVTYNRLTPIGAEGGVANESDAQAVYLEHTGSNSRQ